MQEGRDPETEGDYTCRILENGTAEITGYSGKGGAAMIPEVLDGHGFCGQLNIPFFGVLLYHKKEAEHD